MALAVVLIAILLGSLLSSGCSGSGEGRRDAGDLDGTGPDGGDADGGEQDGGEQDGGPDVGVLTESGWVVGTQAEEGAQAFLGIPYAAPPVGDLRFRSPQPVPPWDGTLVADRFPPACLQSQDEQTAGQEDCLYLNVWRPAPGAAGGEPLPVMVFVHGGGNVTGSTSEERSGVRTYDGARLSARGEVVVVTLQYRLNILGYMVEDSLDEDGQLSGNYGLRDQVAALGWVARNIAAFGGDPARVLLFGESGGAADVCALLAAPSAWGLFQSAVVMSGGCRGRLRYVLRNWSEEVIEAVGCAGVQDRADCLRAVDAAVLVSAASRPSTVEGLISTPAGPTVDGQFLPERPVDAFAAGRHPHVPTVIGVTADETSSPLFGIRLGLTYAEYAQWVQALFADAAQSVLERYSVAAYGTPRAALVALTTDSQFVCPSRRTLRALAASQQAPLRQYIYSHVFEGESSSGFDGRIFGAAHGFELIPLFQHVDQLSDYSAIDPDYFVQDEMLRLWTDLAKGIPSGWPEFDLQQKSYLEIREPLTVGQAYRQAECDFLESL